ncbi:MAG TPA: hypothetical protein PK513_02380 [Alphaproteobacteria bacterium]|nr:hypothetical protein [Alphaproteobacteria bacterium]USO05900.1 MAG: hypothetical protein H6859_01470 [Rhodospirillales bacterium]HOO81332.1 hypothetical protein [Alphaproteobacteria bacterium]
MLNAQDTQYTLKEDAQIHYQPQVSNPLPGEAIAMLVKGERILKPKVVMLDGASIGDVDRVALRAHLEGWLERHIANVLEPLVALEDMGDAKAPVKGIAFQVYQALGIAAREQLEDLIGELDADDRQDLRAKKIRLGPILVFIPALNKPAAVRLRALLWGLWNDKDLPMDCPKDGIVSFAVDSKAVDKAFYQAIAYPVYGGRAIRIDMLDRVISGVYDAAEGGKFKAAHQWAEWLGCSIEGLYEVLEAMGHQKVYDPAEAVEEAGREAQSEVAVKSLEEEVVAEADAGNAAKDEKALQEKPEQEKAEQVKPELATFRLKKGKAFSKNKPVFKQSQGKQGKNFKDKPKGKRSKTANRSPKIMSTGPEKRLEDSPFAVLEQLKQKSNEKK